MPNHITTVCEVTGPEEMVAAFHAAHIRRVDRPSDDHVGEFFDFASIVPKPACVDETSSGSDQMLGLAILMGHALFINFEQQFPWLASEMAKTGHRLDAPGYRRADQVRAWAEKYHPKALEEGRKSARCLGETGYADWYEWDCAHWGTKWNSYSYEFRSREPGRFVFKFETAWSPPRPIFDKIAELWPELTIVTSSIDEGGGAWSGRYHGDERTLDRVEETRAMHLLVYGHTERIDPDPDEAERGTP